MPPGYRASPRRARSPLPLLALRLALVFLAAACATFQRGTLDPVGRYELTSAGGQPVSGTITITGEPGDYTVVMFTGALLRDMRFEHVSLNGRRMSARTRTPSGSLVVLDLTFEGDRITGEWAVGRRSGTLRGRRIDEG